VSRKRGQLFVLNSISRFRALILVMCLFPCSRKYKQRRTSLNHVFSNNCHLGIQLKYQPFEALGITFIFTYVESVPCLRMCLYGLLHIKLWNILSISYCLSLQTYKSVSFKSFTFMKVSKRFRFKYLSVHELSCSRNTYLFILTLDLWVNSHVTSIVCCNCKIFTVNMG